MPAELIPPTARSPFRVKICGITRPEDASMAAGAGADAIGLNFYPGSPRCVTLEQAQAIAAAMPAGVARVGVFVNADLAEMRRIADSVPLDYVQLHGDEPPQAIAALDVPVIRAFRCGSAGLMPVGLYLEACRQAGRLPAAVLIDAYAPGAFGGTGQTLDWPALAAGREHLAGLPLILAGGLTAENVAAAIAAARPDGVDTASGVESSPGVKDAARVRAFVAAATT
jgi:phosphoribosylanthranilate isomerase